MFLSAEEDVLTDCLSLDSLDREEMKSLQAALQKQLDEANERAEKQQATVRRRRTDRQPPVPLKQACHLSHRPLGVPCSLPSQSAFFHFHLLAPPN